MPATPAGPRTTPQARSWLSRSAGSLRPLQSVRVLNLVANARAWAPRVSAQFLTKKVFTKSLARLRPWAEFGLTSSNDVGYVVSTPIIYDIDIIMTKISRVLDIINTFWPSSKLDKYYSDYRCCCTRVEQHQYVLATRHATSWPQNLPGKVNYVRLQIEHRRARLPLRHWFGFL